MKILPVIAVAMPLRTPASIPVGPEIAVKMPKVDFRLIEFMWGSTKEAFYRCTHPGCSGGTCEAFLVDPGEVPETVIRYMHDHAALHGVGL